MTTYDLIVIGAGPGGYETAVEAVALGKKTALIERDKIGGTCLNRGCIPTKALCRSAEVMTTLSDASSFGIESTGVSVNFSEVMNRKDRIVNELRDGVATLIKDVDLISGEAVFLSKSVIRVNDEEYTAPEIIIATGSMPSTLDISGKENALSSDDILSLEYLPKSLAIIGGGVIGMEFASVFASFGVEVTVLEYCKEILPSFDIEIAKRLRMSLKRRGITVITGAKVTSIPEKGIVNYELKGKHKSVETEIVLMAVGRKPVIPDGLKELGAVIERDAISVGDDMCVRFTDGIDSNEVRIYAIGDVNARCMLAHVATMHGLVALGLSELKDIIPSAVFTNPECATVGLTEEKCINEGRNIKIGKATFRSNGKALSMGETDGLVKIIVDADSDEILGCHICGAHASDMVQEMATAMNAGIKSALIKDAVHAHPTLSELVKAAVPK